MVHAESGKSDGSSAQLTASMVGVGASPGARAESPLTVVPKPWRLLVLVEQARIRGTVFSVTPLGCSWPSNLSGAPSGAAAPRFRRPGQRIAESARLRHFRGSRSPSTGSRSLAWAWTGSQRQSIANLGIAPELPQTQKGRAATRPRARRNPSTAPNVRGRPCEPDPRQMRGGVADWRSGSGRNKNDVRQCLTFVRRAL